MSDRDLILALAERLSVCSRLLGREAERRSESEQVAALKRDLLCSRAECADLRLTVERLQREAP